MTERLCRTCQRSIEGMDSRKLYCAERCRRNAPPALLVTRPCDVCKQPFLQKKGNQLYCSRECYPKGWFLKNPGAAAARAKQKRAARPEWMRSNDRRYYRNHRGKIIRERPWKYLLQSARLRAKEKGLPYELTNAWGGERWTGKCEITGVPFQVNGVRGPHPFSPSIDRRDPAAGYTEENTRFVLWGCNAVKGVGTDADMLAIAKAIVAALDPA